MEDYKRDLIVSILIGEVGQSNHEEGLDPEDGLDAYYEQLIGWDDDYLLDEYSPGDLNEVERYHLVSNYIPDRYAINLDKK